MLFQLLMIAVNFSFLLASSSSSEIPSEPTYITGDWSECSQSCGQGFRSRSVECKIFLEFSRTIATLPDEECAGLKPTSTEVCFGSKCSVLSSASSVGKHLETKNITSSVYDSDSVNSIEWPEAGKGIPKDSDSSLKTSERETYEWRSDGFTPCSASCLGGTQESRIQCIRVRDGKVVSLYLCDIEDKPDSITRTCNDHPCPPRWRVSEYTPCSKTCGGGIQTRAVTCIHEITRGSDNTIELDTSRCRTQTKPRTERYCNVFDCKPRWVTNEWSSCSVSCGGGVRNREVKCIREHSFGQQVTVPGANCPRSVPPAEEPCNQHKCLDEDDESRGPILIDDALYVQREPLEKLTLKIGGKAVVFEGTTLKIRCPRRRSEDLGNDLQRVLWFKDNKKIGSSAKLYTTSKQALRIKRVSTDDAGVYSCSVSGNRAQLILSIKKFPGSKQPFSEDKITKRRKKFGFRKRKQEQQLFLGPNEVISTDDESKQQEATGSSVRYFADQTFRRDSNGESLGDFGGGSGHYNNDNIIVDDTNSDGNDKKTNVGDEASASSSASRAQTITFPNMKQVLSNLGSSFSVPSHPQDVVSNDEDDSSLMTGMTNSLRRTKSIDTKRDGLFLDGVSDSKELLSVLGKSSMKDLDFTWINSPWSSCSETCGAVGIQVRGTQCVVRSGSMTKVVDENLCHDAGLKRPQYIRDCQVSCVQWMESEWSECKECVKNGFGNRARDVKCTSINGTSLPEEHCPLKEKPDSSEECPKESCQAVWVTGPWSDCPAECGKTGMKTRMIQCLWKGTFDEAPKNQCIDLVRPSVTQICQSEQDDCEEQGDSCVDRSKHCLQAKSFNMCQYSYYQKECCLSCRP